MLMWMVELIIQDILQASNCYEIIKMIKEDAVKVHPLYNYLNTVETI